jgi:hypothetical protein
MIEQDIAKAIFNRPNKGSHLIAQSDARQLLGEEGFQKALQRGWLIPDLETGYVSIAQAATALSEMKALAEDATGRTFRNGTMKVVGMQVDPTTRQPVSYLVKETARENDPAAPQTTMAIAALTPQDKTELGIT